MQRDRLRILGTVRAANRPSGLRSIVRDVLQAAESDRRRWRRSVT
ncbi:MAG: hypothetical protein ACRDRY_23850 [Pseudonocardiaceae bacterium]